MDKKRFIQKAQGCLLGVCIGDAMGMPVETWKHEQIMELNEGKGVTGFMSPQQTRVRDTAGLKAGSTTDDWQLTEVMAKSLIRSRGELDIVDCAHEHVKALKQSTFGWGKTTQSAIETIARGERNPLKDPLPPAAPGKGCGNGIIMKIAPIAIANAAKGKDVESLWHDCKRLGALTHPDIRASIAAFPVALVMRYLLRANEDDVLTTGSGLTLLNRIIQSTGWAEEKEGIETDFVSDQLELAGNAIVKGIDMRCEVGCGFHAIETAAFTIGTFLLNPQSFTDAVLGAVNAGGDTDTNASIVAALVGANCGTDSIPEAWRSFNPAFDEAATLANELCESCW